MRPLSALLLPLLFFVAACSEPPQKEIDRAQGGIDAARAAGAELYAKEAFAAATAALQQAHDAVAQRDYRLALTRALDANDRAQEAARGAADGKAHARSDAERVINAAASPMLRLKAKISTDSDRVGAKDLATATQTVHDAEAALQKARAALSVGDYLSVQELMKGLDVTINARIQAFDAAVAAKPAKRVRRVR
jgi:hypothetical protein